MEIERGFSLQIVLFIHDYSMVSAKSSWDEFALECS